MRKLIAWIRIVTLRLMIPGSPCWAASAAKAVCGKRQREAKDPRRGDPAGIRQRASHEPSEHEGAAAPAPPDRFAQVSERIARTSQSAIIVSCVIRRPATRAGRDTRKTSRAAASSAPVSPNRNSEPFPQRIGSASGVHFRDAPHRAGNQVKIAQADERADRKASGPVPAAPRAEADDSHGGNRGSAQDRAADKRFALVHVRRG